MVGHPTVVAHLRHSAAHKTEAEAIARRTHLQTAHPMAMASGKMAEVGATAHPTVVARLRRSAVQTTDSKSLLQRTRAAPCLPTKLLGAVLTSCN